MKTIRPASLAREFSATFCLFLALASAVSAQNSAIPIVAVHAIQPVATLAQPGAFTVYRFGSTNATLNVWYDLGGTASNGVDYATIAPHLLQIPAGATSNNIVITPLTNPPAGVVETVVLILTNSPMMTPVNYQIGWPSAATVYIEGNGVTNLPPRVNIYRPTNGATIFAPDNVPIFATASDSTGIASVEFFADGKDLGPGTLAGCVTPIVTCVACPPPLPICFYYLFWTNAPVGAYALTAVATDNGGLSTTSPPVNITVQLPPTNLPPVVRITSPPNGSVFRAPVKIPIYAYAADAGGPVSSVEFFADGVSLGLGHHVMTAMPLPGGGQPYPPPSIPIVVTNFWELTWTNPPPGTKIALTAEAADNSGLSTTSAPVFVSILASPPPPTNRPALVSIVATDPVGIEGTNCWTWPGLISPAATWSNWFASGTTFRLFTNCGPKNATISVFRSGATNDDIDVAYAIGGTATNGIDYVTLPGAVTIPAGSRRADITIVPLDDGPPDITSTVVLKLVPGATGTNYLLGYPRAAAAMILDSQSPRIATGIVPGPAFNLAAPGPDGAWFHVEYSTNLVNWTSVCTNQVINGVINFVDPDAASNPARFYRTVPEAGPPTQ